jgi:hypothetical protein
MTEPDMEGLLEHVGIRTGRSTPTEVFGYCPGHKELLGRSDRNPTTWSVNRFSLNHFCFSCTYGGTLQELIVEQQGGTVWGASSLMRQYGIDPSDISDLPENFYDRRRTGKAPEHLDESLLDEFVDPPLKAIRSRHLSPTSVREYGVRWDAEERCWITPIRLVGGALLGWQAKSKRFFDNYPPKVPKSKTLFGVDRLENGVTAILVESPLDVCRIYSAGFLGGVSSYGVYVHDDQMRLLLSITDELIIALDNDDQGIAETHRLITGKRLVPRKKFNKPGVPWAKKFAMAVFNYGDSSAKDPGEMSDEEIEWGIDNAIPALDWEA